MTDQSQSVEGAAGAGDQSAAAGSNGDFLKAFEANPELKGYVENKAWKDPIAAVSSYRELEKLFKADRIGNTVIVPDFEKGKPEEIGGFWKRVGRPDTADGYNLPDTLKDDPMAKWFRDAAFKSNLPSRSAEGIIAEYQKFTETFANERKGQMAADHERDRAELKQAWGKDYEANSELGERALEVALNKLFPSDSEKQNAFVDNLIAGVGLGAARKLFHLFGAQLKEHLTADSEGSATFSNMSLEAAKVKKRRLMESPEFAKKYANGDKGSRAQMDELNEIIARNMPT